MLIRAGYEIRFDTEYETPMLAMLSIHPSRNKDLRTAQRIVAAPDVPMYDYFDPYGNVCTRLSVPPGGLTLSADFTIEDDGLPDATPPWGPPVPVDELPDDILMYLLGSRYCETDRLMATAWGLFGHLRDGREKAAAIATFVHNHVRFGYEHARADRTGWNTYQDQAGVERDFAHLAITLCRCMNIPARYCTGYLGDIGVPRRDAPMDFGAWCEVYLGEDWYVLDARHNRPRIGRIAMAYGRDATDTALTTAFGPAALAEFVVTTEEVTDTN
ncbi:transglutaminase-like domain-containing protein [Sphingomonas profundi]|uniref:transglutaminase-like domain-containing protein n=1 Tax=Alterirhizorhabdus profundi TaxID=2681549 RepID=UPI0012E911FD|nr:transglutaminase family protein [Sphingomonas profundi]